MKRRYWLTAALLLLSGLFFYLCVYGFQFTGLFLCVLSVLPTVYGILDMLKRKHPRPAKLLHRLFTIALALIAAAAAATGIGIGVSCGGSAEQEAEYVIVLGAGVNGTVPSESLRERLEAAEDYLTAHPDAVAVLSGGKGGREHISEAECMYRWLTARGIPSARLRKEERSTSTKENLRYSAALIEAECGSLPERIAVISAEYHLCRAAIFAREVGITPLCCPARTQNRLFFCNMFLREIGGVWAALLFA